MYGRIAFSFRFFLKSSGRCLQLRSWRTKSGLEEREVLTSRVYHDPTSELKIQNCIAVRLPIPLANPWQLLSAQHVDHTIAADPALQNDRAARSLLHFSDADRSL